MKRPLLIVVLLAFVATSAFAQYTAVGLVKNSKHDLSSGSTATVKSSDLNQICAFCHVAHKAATAPAGTQAPLWNHTLGGTITGVYSSSTFNALTTDQAALGAATWGTATSSHLCMSCHDGTIGVNSIYKFATPTVGAIVGHTDVNSKLISNSNLGADLSSSHPVNFTYQGAAWLVTQTHVAVPAGGKVSSANLPLDSAGKLQCFTCHSVHVPTNTYFLRDTLNGSQICLDCHLST